MNEELESICRPVFGHGWKTTLAKYVGVNPLEEIVFNTNYKLFPFLDTGMTYKNDTEHCKECNVFIRCNKHFCW